MSSDATSEAEEDAVRAEFESLVPDPRATDLIYWPKLHPLSRDLAEEDLTAEHVVELACRYRPIEL